jgi:hypothetical protein
LEHSAGLFHWIEQSAAGLFVRDATLIYPIANVLHVLAAMVFFAAVAVMDLRVLGLIGGESIAAVLARYRRVAILALALLVATGLFLFVPEAAALARNASFRIKVALILIGLANVLVLERAMRGAGEAAHVPRAAKVSAVASLILWLMVAACGRFIAYA